MITNVLPPFYGSQCISIEEVVTHIFSSILRKFHDWLYRDKWEVGTANIVPSNRQYLSFDDCLDSGG